MTDAQKRQYVSDLYPGPKWKKRVEKMGMAQVLAIYLDHQNDGAVPEHNEDDPYFVEDSLEEITPDPGFLRPHMGQLAPQGPHANEDDFPIY